MGIPAYFSHIIKNHIYILKKFELCYGFRINNLYMDCNSIIYDCIRAPDAPVHSYTELYSRICEQIQQYVDTIKPSHTLYIAFDGVAPLAKMNQQKSRRYRTAFLENAGIVPKSTFSSCLITPGTEFMNGLARHLYAHPFRGAPNIVVSAADQPGEGEHKLFQHIRNYPDIHVGQNTAVYGLDADLLMLSIFHNERTNLFVLREAPEFAKSLNADLENGALYALNIKSFCEMICREMDTTSAVDYAFLCFMLGNDFLPHFPALNIRTHGIRHLMNAYAETIGNDKNNRNSKNSKNVSTIVSNNGVINWNQFHRIVRWLAVREETWIKAEYTRRAHVATQNGSGEGEALINNVPVSCRMTEHYINPELVGWQERYNKALLHSVPVDYVVQNYCEGLEWVLKYYTMECYDWRWTYMHHYPPLLADLAKGVPKQSTAYFQVPFYRPFSARAQLHYVLPPEYLDLTPAEAAKSYYKFEGEFEWAFCRYFWESHLLMDTMPIAELDKL